MHYPTDRIAYTMVFVTPIVEHCLKREIAQWVHPMKDRSDDPSLLPPLLPPLLPRSYISLPLLFNMPASDNGLSRYDIESTSPNAANALYPSPLHGFITYKNLIGKYIHILNIHIKKKNCKSCLSDTQ